MTAEQTNEEKALWHGVELRQQEAAGLLALADWYAEHTPKLGKNRRRSHHFQYALRWCAKGGHSPVRYLPGRGSRYDNERLSAYRDAWVWVPDVYTDVALKRERVPEWVFTVYPSGRVAMVGSVGLADAYLWLGRLLCISRERLYLPDTTFPPT